MLSHLWDSLPLMAYPGSYTDVKSIVKHLFDGHDKHLLRGASDKFNSMKQCCDVQLDGCCREAYFVQHFLSLESFTVSFFRFSSCTQEPKSC